MTRLQATNSLGYGVQWLTKDGWKFWDDVVYDNWDDARSVEGLLRLSCTEEIETRVYEVLDMGMNDE